MILNSNILVEVTFSKYCCLQIEFRIPFDKVPIAMKLVLELSFCKLMKYINPIGVGSLVLFIDLGLARGLL